MISCSLTNVGVYLDVLGSLTQVRVVTISSSDDDVRLFHSRTINSIETVVHEFLSHILATLRFPVLKSMHIEHHKRNLLIFK